MRIATLVVVALMASFVAVSAQTPYIAVFFNAGHSQMAKDCPGPVIDKWYVAAVNFNSFIAGAEFAIQYPPAVMWLADLNTPMVTVGNTPTGISMGFPLPMNGYTPLDLCQVQVFWNCDHCVDPFINNLVKVVPHPNTGFLGCTQYPGFGLLPGVGLTSVICSTIPTEKSTWGQVKALYGE